jgi:hypothetical protein
MHSTSIDKPAKTIRLVHEDETVINHICAMLGVLGVDTFKGKVCHEIDTCACAVTDYMNENIKAAADVGEAIVMMEKC